jgi:hypothetical protein
MTLRSNGDERRERKGAAEGEGAMSHRGEEEEGGEEAGGREGGRGPGEEEDGGRKRRRWWRNRWRWGGNR